MGNFFRVSPFLSSFAACALVALGCSSSDSGTGKGFSGGSSGSYGSSGSASGSGGSSGSGGATGATVESQCDQLGVAECQHLMADCTTVADAGGATVGDQCTEIGKALCAQSVTCGTSASADTCLTTAVNNCCGSSGLCNAPAASGEDTVAACKTALGTQSCTDAAAGVPSACAGIVKPVANADTTAACQKTMVQACCGNAGLCTRNASSSQTSISACTQAIASSSCAPSTTLPPACQQVVKVASAPIHLQDRRLASGEGAIGAAVSLIH
jgi:hypothetical protein